MGNGVGVGCSYTDGVGAHCIMTIHHFISVVLKHDVLRRGASMRAPESELENMVSSGPDAPARFIDKRFHDRYEAGIEEVESWSYFWDFQGSTVDRR